MNWHSAVGWPRRERDQGHRLVDLLRKQRKGTLLRACTPSTVGRRRVGHEQRRLLQLPRELLEDEEESPLLSTACRGPRRPRPREQRLSVRRESDALRNSSREPARRSPTGRGTFVHAVLPESTCSQTRARQLECRRLSLSLFIFSFFLFFLLSLFPSFFLSLFLFLSFSLLFDVNANCPIPMESLATKQTGLPREEASTSPRRRRTLRRRGLLTRRHAATACRRVITLQMYSLSGIFDEFLNEPTVGERSLNHDLHRSNAHACTCTAPLGTQQFSQ